MDLVEAMLAATAALDAAQVTHALCGGIAVTLHGHPRATRDIDLLIPPDALDPALDALRPLGWKFPAFPMTFGEGTDAPRRVQRVSRLEGKKVLSVDLILADGPLATVLEHRITVETADQRVVAVVSLEGLGTMKRLAGRPQDLADLEHLGIADG